MLADKDKCTGCAACFSICPANAIKMEADSTGFLYPQVNEDLCINCGKCQRACPVISQTKKNASFDPNIYIFQHSDENVRQQSTSGGAFSAIAEEIIKKGGVVFGASFDEDWCVRHTYTETLEGLAQFRNSKYVQSEIRDTYKETKKFLEQKRLVCFSGTPCQIHGLVKFLGKDYENLITVDLICLAVPSPKVFKKYLELRGNDVSEIKNIQFRNKDFGYSYPTMLIKGDGKKKLYRNGSESDEWLRLFLKKYSTRNSCKNCLAQMNRASDFTIYDCNNIYEKNLEIDDDKGTSNIIVWTEKANNLFAQFCYKHTVIKSDETVSRNPKKIVRNNTNNFDYEIFYEDLDELTAEAFFRKYVPVSLKIKLIRFARLASYKLGIYKKIRAVIRSKRKK